MIGPGSDKNRTKVDTLTKWGDLYQRQDQVKANISRKDSMTTFWSMFGENDQLSFYFFFYPHLWWELVPSRNWNICICAEKYSKFAHSVSEQGFWDCFVNAGANNSCINKVRKHTCQQPSLWIVFFMPTEQPVNWQAGGVKYKAGSILLTTTLLELLPTCL